ncbi:hypothetical protein RchiOBHm_Chr5g0080221 [Rosa chinensis]|uniref:Uncharacterized protein n=1 Tax=Rosa chinensis TaxID=74649 RepID=A0A2P6QMR6_ROSCH|nr:hypothetical protein RchiOBHm_Chr5g0080221 [Rosa chinensis]
MAWVSTDELHRSQFEAEKFLRFRWFFCILRRLRADDDMQEWSRW